MKRLKEAIIKLTSLDRRLATLSKYQKVLFISIAGYAIILSILTSLRHYCFQTFAFDFGIFVQIFWNSLHGNFMFSQPRGTLLNPPSFLGVHTSPLLLFLIPIYAVVSSPYILLIIQSVVLAFPAYFIYKIGLKTINKEKIALLFAIAYLVYPGTLWSNWYDFHLEAFVPLFLSMAYYYYLCRDKTKLLISMILLLATFETAAIIVLFFIFYIFVRELFLRSKYKDSHQFIGKKMLAILVIVAALSVAYFLLSEQLMSSVWPERGTYEPARIFGKINYNTLLVKISYLFILSAPLAFLSFNSPIELIPAAPYLFLAIATDYEPYYTVNWQYPALIIIPFLVSAVLGSVGENLKKVRTRLVFAFLCFLLLFSPASPLMSQFSSYWSMPIPTVETNLKHQALSFLGENSTVLAQENIFPHVAERKVAYTLWPAYLEPPDYIVVDVLDPFVFYHEPATEPANQTLFNFLNITNYETLNTYDYGIVAMANGLMVLKRGYSGPRNILMPLHSHLEIQKIRKQFISFQDSFLEATWFVPDWVEVKGDHLLLKKGFSGNAWWGPYITVPPGKYHVEVQLSIEENVEGQLIDIIPYYWTPAKTTYYHYENVTGNEIRQGEINTVRFDFEIDQWVPAIEVVGMPYGRTDISVYSVELEMIE